MCQKIFHGSNLIPESLEIGEPKVAGTASFDELKQCYIVAFSGDSMFTQTISQDGYSYNGIPSSVTFILCNNIGGLNACLHFINEAQQGDKIVSVFSIPRLAVKTRLAELESPDPSVTTYVSDPMTYNYTQSAVTKTLTSTPSSLDGYTPRNQKLRTYPYLYVGFNPANGTNKVFRYEDFANGTPTFNLISEINPNPSVYFIPQNYRGQTGDSLSDVISLNGYPNISYKNDVFNSWLAQNSGFLQINQERENLNYSQNKFQSGLNLISGITGMVGNIAGGNASGTINSMTSLGGTAIGAISNEANHELNIREQMATIEAQKLVPDNVTMSGSNATLLGYNKIHENIFTRYNIKAEFARKIDKYFDQFRLCYK